MPNGKRPVFQTDVFRNTSKLTDEISDKMSRNNIGNANGTKTVVLASTDVHEHALFVMNALFEEYGVNVIYLGPESDTEDIVEAAVKNDADAMAVSTHNGAALDVGKRLMAAMKEKGCTSHMYIGGMLNQCVVGQQMPVDVEDDLKRMGFDCNVEFMEMIREIVDGTCGKNS